MIIAFSVLSIMEQNEKILNLSNLRINIHIHPAITTLMFNYEKYETIKMKIQNKAQLIGSFFL